MSATSGQILNIQHFSLHDGPGIRTTIFFKGCPLRCHWCANPDTQEPGPELIHSQAQCMGCGECIQVCPEGCIRLTGDSPLPVIDRTECTLCRQCIDACPGHALRLAGEELSLNQVLTEVDQEKHFYRHSGGGVTLSGGEPLVQAEFARAILKKCHTWGIHTAIETCGQVPFKNLEMVADVCDLIFFDLKHALALPHQKFTGGDNVRILENLKRISQRHPRILVRTPVVPGVNADARSLRLIGEFITRQTRVLEMELLNFHQLGAHKYQNLGRQNPMAAAPVLDAEAFKALAQEFASQFPALTVRYHS